MPHTKSASPKSKKSNWCANNCKMLGFFIMFGPAMFIASFPSLGTFWQIGNEWAYWIVQHTMAPGIDYE